MGDRIADIQTILNEGYHEVCIEISGKCNARCKYCPSGKKNSEKREMMKPELFEKVLDRLISYGVIGKKSQVDLFWWGEPFLNPHLNEILEITQNKDIAYVLSTNGFFYRKIPSHLLKNLKRFIISMPGFSQESYDKIHQFNFQTIKSNIERYASDLASGGMLDKIWVAYHIYQFNLDELYDAYEFCEELNISFNPGYAFPLLVKERIGYATNTLEAMRKEEMVKELVTFQLDKMIMESDRKSCIYQKRNFIVDEMANVYGCLNLEHDDENYCGNLITDDRETIFKKIAELEICKKCIACGVAPSDLSFKFFYDAWYQMMKTQKFLEKECSQKIDNWNLTKNILKIIIHLRNAEQKPDKSIYFSKAQKIMERNRISKESIDEAIEQWAMRPSKLKEDFHRFLEMQRDI